MRIYIIRQVYTLTRYNNNIHIFVSVQFRWSSILRWSCISDCDSFLVCFCLVSREWSLKIVFTICRFRISTSFGFLIKWTIFRSCVYANLHDTVWITLTYDAKRFQWTLVKNIYFVPVSSVQHIHPRFIFPLQAFILLFPLHLFSSRPVRHTVETGLAGTKSHVVVCCLLMGSIFHFDFQIFLTCTHQNRTNCVQPWNIRFDLTLMNYNKLISG